MFKPTMQLRYRPIYRGVDFEGEPVLYTKHLQQKYINVESGNEEWRDIEISI